MCAKKAKKSKSQKNTPLYFETSPHPVIRTLDTVAMISLLIMLAGVTVLFTIITQNIVMIKPFFNFQFTYFAFLMFIFAAYIRRKFEFEYAEPFKPLIMMLLWFTFTFILTYFKYAAMEEINRFYSYAIIMIMVVQVFTTKKHIKIAIALYLILILASVVYVTFQDLGIDFINWGMKVHVSFYGNPNFYSGYLATTMGILYVLYLYLLTSNFAKNLLKTDQPAPQLIFILLFIFIGPAIIIYTIATITARAAMIGTLVGLLFTIAMLLFTGLARDIKEMAKLFIKARYARYASIGGIAFLLVSFLVLYAFNTAFNEAVNAKAFHFAQRAKSVFQKKYGTNKSRLIFYWGAMRMTEHMRSYPFGFDDLRDYQTRGLIKVQPLVGYGVGSFQKAFPFHRPPFYHHWGVSHNTLHVHDEYIEILAETGFIGLAFWLLFLVTFFKYALSYIPKIQDRFLKLISIGLLAGIVGALVHNFFTVNLRWTSSAVQFWFIAGLIIATIKVGAIRQRKLYEYDAQLLKKSVSPPTPFIYAITIGGIVGYIFLTVANIYTFKADMYLKRLEMYIGSRMWDQAKTAGKTAISYNPYTLSAWYKLGYVYLNRGDLNNAYNCYAKILRLAPRYAQIHYNLGLLEQQRGNIFKSLDEFKLAGLIENNVVNYMRIANLYLALEKYQPAIFYFRRALDIDPYDSRDYEYQKIGYEQLAKLYLSLNKDEEAIRLLRIMVLKNIKKSWAIKILIEKLAAKQRYNDAILYLEKMKTLAPNDVNVFYSLANLYRATNQFEKAYINYNQALRLISLSPDSNEREILDKIISFYEILFKGNKKNPQLADLLGIAYLKAGNYKKARAYFTRALKIKPDYTLAKQHLEFLKRRINESK